MGFFINKNKLSQNLPLVKLFNLFYLCLMLYSPLNPWVKIHNRAEFGAGIGFAAFE